MELPCGIIAPYTRTILSNSVSATRQAQIFAAFSAIESIATLLAPVYAVIYGVTVKSGVPALAFLVMACSALLSGAIATYVRISPDLRSSLPDQSSSDAEFSENKSLMSSFDAAEDCGGSFVLDDEIPVMYDYNTLRRLDYPTP